VSAFDPDATEILMDDRANFVASYENIILQVRRGELTLPALEQVASDRRVRHAARRRDVGSAHASTWASELASLVTWGR
jgi:hypothetical protein